MIYLAIIIAACAAYALAWQMGRALSFPTIDSIPDQQQADRQSAAHWPEIGGGGGAFINHHDEPDGSFRERNHG